MMVFDEAWQLLAEVRAKRPLIHCITNYVTAGDVANMILAAGASPVMADGIPEVEEITELSQGLVLNIGTLKAAAIDAMLLAGKRAVGLGHPVVFDPVGAGASRFRTDTARQIIRDVRCTVIRGNASEIGVLAGGKTRPRGVDADEREWLIGENRQEQITAAGKLSRETGAVIVITGPQDLIADEKRTCLIDNGVPMLGQVTGTGCMLDGIIAAFLAAGSADMGEQQHRQKVDTGEQRFWQTVYAVAAAGICGELAEQKTTASGGGTGSFRMYLMDAMSNLNDRQIKEGARLEV